MRSSLVQIIEVYLYGQLRYQLKIKIVITAKKLSIQFEMARLIHLCIAPTKKIKTKPNSSIQPKTLYHQDLPKTSHTHHIQKKNDRGRRSSALRHCSNNRAAAARARVHRTRTQAHSLGHAARHVRVTSAARRSREHRVLRRGHVYHHALARGVCMPCRVAAHTAHFSLLTSFSKARVGETRVRVYVCELYIRVRAIWCWNATSEREREGRWVGGWRSGACGDDAGCGVGYRDMRGFGWWFL